MAAWLASLGEINTIRSMPVGSSVKLEERLDPGHLTDWRDATSFSGIGLPGQLLLDQQLQDGGTLLTQPGGAAPPPPHVLLDQQQQQQQPYSAQSNSGSTSGEGIGGGGQNDQTQTSRGRGRR